MKNTQSQDQLMIRRIRQILLICNNYDNFSLEEDGHIESRMQAEYADLSLSNPPSFERAESTKDALELMKSQRFDLIITMYNVGEMDVFEFSEKAFEIPLNGSSTHMK